MIKIFQLINSIQLGGAETVAFNLSEFCKSYSPDNFDFVVVELRQTQTVYSEEKKIELDTRNIKTITLTNGSKRFSLIIGSLMLAYHVLKEKPDIIHSHTDLPDLVLSNTKRIFSFLQIKFPKIVRTIHNTQLWPTHDKLGRYTEKKIEDDWVVGVSEAALIAYDKLRIKFNLSASSHKQIIYNGCSLPKRSEHPFKIDSGKINIAFCGRFEVQKGIDILITRIKEANIRFHDVFLFHIIGNGTFQREVQMLSENNANVFLYDAIPNISEKLYAFDFLIMPSRFEGLVLTSIEASFSKVPVIAAFAPGLSETLLTDWPLQFHLEKGDELLTIFEKIKNNEYDLVSLKNKAYSYVSEKFSQTTMIEEYSKLYLKINE